MKTLLSILFVVCITSAIPVQSDGILRGKVAVLSFPDTVWWDQWTHFQEVILSDPTLDMEWYMRGELGSEQMLLNGLRRNRIQIISVSSQGLATVVPEIGLLMSPYLFESFEEADFVFDNYLSDLVVQWLEEKGMVPISWAETGWVIMYTKDTVVRRPEDLKGLTLRVVPNVYGAAFMQAVGGDYAPLDLSELVPSLQTGLLNGGLTNVVFVHNAISDIVNHVTLTNHSYENGATLANKAWFDAATVKQQNTLIAASGPLDKNRRDVRAYVESITRGSPELGLTYHHLSHEERALWIKASEGALERIIATSGPRAHEFLNRIKIGKSDYHEKRISNVPQ